MKRIRRGERGSSLIIALAFLALFSLWLSATLSSTQSGLHIAADGACPTKALVRGRRRNRTKDPGNALRRGRGPLGRRGLLYAEDAPVQLQNPPQAVFVRCDPAGDSGLGETGESSPPIGIIALSNGALGESAYQQYGNDIVRIDGGVFSNTPPFFQASSTTQLNLCPRNAKTVTGLLVRTSRTVTVPSSPGPFVPEDAADGGVPIVGNGIPTGNTIEEYVTPNVIRMKKAAISSGTKVIRFREDYPKLQSHCRVPTAAEDPLNEVRKKGKFTAVPQVPGQTSCNPALVIALWHNCNSTNPPYTYAPDPDGVDKNYPVDKSSGFSHQSVPACSSGALVVPLEPGRYNDAAALTSLTTSCDKLIWFKPGSYYFDFGDDDIGDADQEWTIGGSNLRNLVVVGGAKTWTGEPFVGYLSYNNSTNRSTVSVCDNSNPPVCGSKRFQDTDVGGYLNAGYNLPYRTVIKSVSGDKKSVTFDGQALTPSFNTGVFTSARSSERLTRWARCATRRPTLLTPESNSSSAGRAGCG